VAKVPDCETDDSIDLFPMADIAGHCQSVIVVAQAFACKLGATGVARQQNHVGTMVGENPGDGFSDTHGGACDYRNLIRQFHVRLVVAGRSEVKLVQSLQR
jgi:hypothetical protein